MWPSLEGGRLRNERVSGDWRVTPATPHQPLYRRSCALVGIQGKVAARATPSPHIHDYTLGRHSLF